MQPRLFLYFSPMPEIEEKKRKFTFLLLPSLFIALLWVVFGVEFLFSLDFAEYAVEPRTLNGLFGILVFPLIHGSIEHIAGNTVSLFVLLVTVRYIFPQLFFRVLLFSYFVPGIITWFIGRPAYHLGASGMIYTLVVFIFISGVIRVNRYLLALSMLVVFMYGSLFWGIFPLEEGISWEGHLGGAVTGFILALWYRNADPIDEVIEKEPDWDEDEDDDSVHDDWKNYPHPNDQNPHITYHYKPHSDDQKPDS